jgi:hypothetical protein
MAVAVTMDFDGTTLEQYDAVIERMGFTPGGGGPQGLLFHWACETPTGIRVTDVWESRERFDRFAQEQIGPITEEVGVPGPPKSDYTEVHGYLTAP